MSKPFSVRIFLADGDPAGIKVVEKSNWTGVGLVFPLSMFARAKDRPELKRTGVYILVGPGETVHRPKVYIGEGDPILPRLNNHDLNKDWWTHAVCFTTKDQSLNKAHIQHLESRMVARAKAANRCEWTNRNEPQEPTLTDAERADAESFLDDLLLCLPTLGYTFLDLPDAHKAIGGFRYHLSARGVNAEGFENSEGFVVLKGSQASLDEVPSIHDYLKEQRATLIKEGILTPSPAAFTLMQDYTFASPSTAAGVMAGRTANGREMWKTKEGRTLKEVQEGVTG